MRMVLSQRESGPWTGSRLELLMRNLRQFGIGSAIFTFVMAVASIAKAGGQQIAYVSSDHGVGRIQLTAPFQTGLIKKTSQKI